MAETLLKTKNDSLDLNLITKLAQQLDCKVPRVAEHMRTKNFLIGAKEALLTKLYDTINESNGI